MAETTPITTAQAMMTATPLVPATPQVSGGLVGRCLIYSPPEPMAVASKNLANATNELKRSMDMASILKEFEW